MGPARFNQYDRLIRSVATEHHLDPMLVKAVVWRESRFDPKKYGGAGERGLMQVSEKAANEWARENKVDNFRVEKLFDPKTNLEAGTWYLHRAFEHWQRNRIRCLLRLPSTTRGQAGPNDGAVEMTSRPCRRRHFSRRSIFLGHGSMSIQSSHATNSTSDVGECDL